MLKKMSLFIFIFIVSSIVFMPDVDAAASCTYGNYTVTRAGGTISVKNSRYLSREIVVENVALDDIKPDGEDNYICCHETLFVDSRYIEEKEFEGERDYVSFNPNTYSAAVGVRKSSSSSNARFGDCDADNTNTNDGSDTPDGENTTSGGEKLTCKDFEIADNVNLVNGLFGLLMIAGPILLIIFGSVDFVKATLASDEQALHKAGINFMKRAIATVLLFLLPLILNIIFAIAFNAGVFGSIDVTEKPTTCIGGETDTNTDTEQQ